MTLSFLLDGDKMRKRLAQILSQSAETETNEKKHEQGGKLELSRTSTFE